MSVGTFLKNSGWAAMAAVMVAGGLSVPASAQDRSRQNRSQSERVERSQQQPVRSGAEQRRQMGQQAAAREQAQQQNRQQRPAAQAPRRADRPATQAPRQGNWQQTQRGERPTAQPQRQRNWQQGQRPAQQADRRDDRRGDWRQNDRNRSYADRDRNRTYRDRDRDWRNNNNNNNNDRRWQNDRRNDGWRADRQAYNRWDHRWRDNSRYNWQRYRNNNRVVFQVGTYYAPYRNYSYRRVGVGGILDSLFFGSRYWINDPWQYRLPDAYGPYRWVRYYDDALLVDTYSGQVVDVIYDFFW